MKPVATCPYCGSDTFSPEAIRADGVNQADPDRYAQSYGHWFNQCANCEGWSLYKDGVQIAVPGKNKRPRKNSEPPV